MRDRAVPSKIEVPVEDIRGQVVLCHLTFEECQIGGTFATTDDLAVAFRCEHIDAKRKPIVFRITFHVERLDHGWIPMDYDRAVEMPREDRLIGAAKIISPLKSTRRLFPLRQVAKLLFDVVQSLMDLDLTRVDPSLLMLLRLAVRPPVRLLFFPKCSLFRRQG